MIWRRVVGWIILALPFFGVLWIGVSFLSRHPVDQSKIYPPLLRFEPIKQISFGHYGGKHSIIFPRTAMDVPIVSMSDEFAEVYIELPSGVDLPSLAFQHWDSDEARVIDQIKYPDTRYFILAAIEDIPTHTMDGYEASTHLTRDLLDRTRIWLKVTIRDFLP